MSTIVPSEEVAMVTLGKDAPGAKLAQSGPQEESVEDPETTLLWGQSSHSSASETAMLEVPERDARPSPEGSHRESTSVPAADHRGFSEPPSAVSDDEEDGNVMPEAAAHVFVPIDPRCIERRPTGGKKQQQQPEQREGKEETERGGKDRGDLEKQSFVSRGYSAQFDDLPSHDGEPAGRTCADRPPCLRNGGCSSANLKAVASMAGATIIFPCLVYGAYVFLPFDAPPMPAMSSRLVYTLRCGAFATFPIIVGMIVYGVSRLCFSSLQPFGQLRRETEIHRHYVSQSVNLFILYFFNIAVLSTYLPQEALKLIPILTALFAISRLLYWLAYAMGRSFRGFGFGLTFMPLVAMLLFNLYSMFLIDSESMFATGDGTEQNAAFKPRYWG